MSNLDDVYERMRAFRDRLEEFQDVLRAGHTDMTNRHDDIAAGWTDAAARDYHARHDPLAETLKRYIDRTGPDYLDFLADKLRALDAYLNGHR